MPVFNCEKYLDESINSILNQTYRDFEFFIINDGSTDNSEKIIKNYQKKDDRINLLTQNNQGVTKSLNKGIRNCRGKYVARMDADDISHPKRFEFQLKYLQNNLNIAIVGSQISIIDDKNEIIKKIDNLPLDDCLIKWELIFGTPLIHPTLMIRKTVFKKFGLYNKQSIFGQDIQMWRKIARKVEFGNLPNNLLKLRQQDDMQNFDKLKYQNNIRISTLESYINDVSGLSHRIKCNQQLSEFFISGKPIFKQPSNFINVILSLKRGFIRCTCENTKQVNEINKRTSSIFFRAFLSNSNSFHSQLLYLLFSIIIYPNIIFKKEYWWHLKQLKFRI